MPKYYCDYCDTYLTHDSPSVRKTHCQGRKHKDNVKYFYQKWMEEQAQHLIDATTAAFKAGKIASNPFAASKGAAIPPPPNLGSSLGSRSGVPPQGPPGMMPPPGMHPAGPMGPGGPMMMGPHGPMPPPMMGMRPPMMGPMGPMGPMMGPIGPMGHMRPPMNGPPPPMVGPPPMKK
ncbi:U1 small nuclear ribonucleoprotein C [Linepithema humile]|uniref:U1 small nuclear ribonucleoprotein C n=1 Tax=Linepithema humile TaxID=83485 RepID=UPI00062317CA|nr:PREDICTED: U1 small nuclear ribonucleoprotein C [Linepithema humile]